MNDPKIIGFLVFVFVFTVCVVIWKAFNRPKPPVSPERYSIFKGDQKRVLTVFDKYDTDVQSVALQLHTAKHNWMTSESGKHWRALAPQFQKGEHTFIEFIGFPEEGIAARLKLNADGYQVIIFFQKENRDFATQVQSLLVEAFQYDTQLIHKEGKVSDWKIPQRV